MDIHPKPGVVVGGGEVAGTVFSAGVVSVVAGTVVATVVTTVVGCEVAAVVVTVATVLSVVGVAISGFVVCMTNVTPVLIVFPVTG